MFRTLGSKQNHPVLYTIQIDMSVKEWKTAKSRGSVKISNDEMSVKKPAYNPCR